MNWLDTLLNLPAVCAFLQSREWSLDFPSQYLARGRVLSDEGKVLDIDHFIGSQSGFVGSARVQGTRSQPYKVSLTGKLERDGWVFWGTCSCPVSEDCKHVAAFVYDLQKAIAGAEEEDDEELAQERWLEALSEAVAEEKPPEVTPEKTPTQAMAFLITPRDDGLLEVGLGKIGYPAGGSPRVEITEFTPQLPANVPAYYREGDWEIVSAFLEKLPHAQDASLHWYEVRVLKGALGAALLPGLFESGRFFLAAEMGEKGDPLPSPLREGPVMELGARWEISETGEYVPSIGLPLHGTQLVEIDGPYYLDFRKYHLGKVKLMEGQSLEFLKLWLRGPRGDAETAGRLSAGMEGRGIPVSVPRPVTLEEEKLQHDGPCPAFRLEREQSLNSVITGRLSFFYDEEEVDFDHGGLAVSKLVREGKLLVIEREIEKEKIYQNQLEQAGLYRIGDIFDFEGEGEDSFGPDVDQEEWNAAWAEFKACVIPAMEKAGWLVSFDESFDLKIANAKEIYTDLSPVDDQIDWFKFETGIVTTEGERASLMTLIADFLESGASIPRNGEVGDDERVVVSDKEGSSFFNLPARRFYRIVQSVRDLYNCPEGMHAVEAADIADELEIDASKTEADLRALGEQLKKKQSHLPAPFPKMIKADLRDYQKDGYQWLQFLARHHLHGILADDMGLGKTLQTLTHIAAEVETGRTGGKPCLVVAPTSVVPNWEAEAKKFAPDLKVLVLHGATRKAKYDLIKKHDLIITSYALLYRDIVVHKEQEYHVAILDEAQYIKNPRALVSKAACGLEVRHRLCLSGTPMENHLGELWSLMTFLMPGLLGAQVTFSKSFRTPIERHKDQSAQRALNSRVRHLILRRTKDQVVQELPPKTEIIHRIALNKEQQEIYESVRSAMDEKVRQAIEDKGLARSQIVVLDALLKLRQICCHPALIKTEIAKKAKRSAKLDFLIELLETLVGEGRRILLFSQFTTMLEMIEEHLAEVKVRFVKITGATRDRKRPVEEFQKGEIPVFIISLKAGGTGLNLTAADTVIHYDPWWNPATENQATDRAHRIGQSNPVFVHKLISEGTIEERILDLQNKKSRLVEALLSEETSKLQLDTEVLKDLLAPIKD